MVRLLALLSTVASVVLVSPGAAVGASAPATLRLDGIGPLRLGMTRTAAVKTGWLSNRGTGCELGGSPLPITYQLRGPAAPGNVVGAAEFVGGKLSSLSFRKGVRTTAGVAVGSTTTAQMVSRYRAKGYKVKATSSSTFQGTFVEVSRHGRPVIGGFAPGGKVIRDLGLPNTAVCE